MSWYDDHVLPRVVDAACGGAGMERLRLRATEGLAGTVLEVGFGSGHNISLYPTAVTEVLAVEPSALARRRAQSRIDASPVPVRHIGLDGQHLPLDDHSVDAALCTFTLCTIPDVDAALAEVCRVVRPGGSFHFLEHGIAPDERVRRWQRRLNSLEQRVAGGCQLVRDPVALVLSAGMELVETSSRYVRGPRPWTYVTVGRAVVGA
ncbi:MAG: class I SAM-dependent methyltransferase [Actinomycetes bacterium]